MSPVPIGALAGGARVLRATARTPVGRAVGLGLAFEAGSRLGRRAFGRAAVGQGQAMGALVGGQIVGQEPGVLIIRTPRGRVLRVKRRARRRKARSRGDRGLSTKDVEKILLLSRAFDGGAP